jgi:hypothetical protein
MVEGNCYCDLWKTNPTTLESQGIPRGYLSIIHPLGNIGRWLYPALLLLLIMALGIGRSLM